MSSRGFVAWANAQALEDQALEAERRRAQQTQDCRRGEHLMITGRKTCPLCGEDL